jgi:hypothetical protein
MNGIYKFSTSALQMPTLSWKKIKQITNIRHSDVNLNPLALPCLRILLASYLPSYLFSMKWREYYTTKIEPPTTPFENEYLSTIT